MYEIYSVGFRVNVLMQDLTPRLRSFKVKHNTLGGVMGEVRGNGCIAPAEPGVELEMIAAWQQWKDVVS